MDKAMWLVLAVTLAVVAFVPPPAEAAISCSTVANDLSPCINYVVYGGAAPPTSCCEGIKTLYKQASATADRQAVCSCIKSVASSATPTIVNNAASLPGKCGVNIPYKISPSTDCAKYGLLKVDGVGDFSIVRSAEY
ncbi:hypothetical protein CASFOL_040074 [Castilleja foliolosa]|uniref:Non-specific lipid-transfer protein n=1 Tax=Castilleja foliolosa TaxID=1961234 RepID=A0ABD3BEH4_9LAMI